MNDRVRALLIAQQELGVRLNNMAVLVVGSLTDASSGLESGEERTPLSERLHSTVMRPEETTAMVQLLVDIGDPLAADYLATREGVVDALHLRYQRLLGRELRARGFLVRGIAYSKAAAKAGSEGDSRVLEYRREEIEVMSGAFVPKVPTAWSTPEPGRVLHVVGTSLPEKQSGYTIRTLYTAKAQAALGLDPHVVTQVGLIEDETAHTVDVAGIPHHRMPGPFRSHISLSAWLQRNTEELAEVVARVRPAVLHAHSDFLNAVSAQAVGNAMNIPVVYETRGFWEESWLSRISDQYGWASLDALQSMYGSPEAYTWRREREEDAREKASHVITLASVMAERIVDAGLPPHRLSLVPNAVEVDTFPQTQRDSELAGQLEIAPDEVVCGYVSSLVEYEGIDTLIDAFAKLRRSTDKRVRLLIVGEGPERKRLEYLAQALGPAGVTFTGNVAHETVDRYYSLIDIFVVPRRPSSVCHLVTPLKPFEAFATARTVVLSDVRALREIAEDSDAAMLFEAGSSASLARVLEELVDNPVRREELAQRGATWVRTHRTWQVNARAYLEIYRSLGVELAG